MGSATVQFDFSLEKLGDEAVGLVASALSPRPLHPIERDLVRDLFWLRAKETEGDWVDLDISESCARLVIEPGFEKGFVAAALRMLGAGHLKVA